MAAGVVAKLAGEKSVSFVTSQSADIFIAVNRSTHFPTRVEQPKEANEYAEEAEMHVEFA